MAEHYYYSIASGSSGNCGLYMADGTAILIDLGVSLRRITPSQHRPVSTSRWRIFRRWC